MSIQIENSTFLDLLDELAIALENNNEQVIERILQECVGLASSEFYRGYDSDALFFLINILKEIQHKNEIVKKYDSIICSIHYKIGEIFSHQGKYDRAKSHFSICVKVEPEKLLDFLEKVWKEDQIFEFDHQLLKRYIDVLNANAVIERKKRSKESLENSARLTTLAFEQAEIHNYPKGKAESLQGLALMSFYEGNYLTGLDLINKSLRILEEIKPKNCLLLGRAYSIKTIPYYHQSNYDIALTWAMKAKECFEKENITIEIPTTIQYIAGIQRAIGQYKEAEKNLLKIISDYKTITSEVVVVISLLTLGSLYFEIGDFDQALGYYKQVLELRAEPNQGRASALGSIAQVKHLQGELNEAKQLFEESITIYKEIPARLEGAFGTNYAYIKLLVDLEDYEEAEQQIQELNNKININAPIDVAYGKMAEAYLEKRKGNIYNADLLLDDVVKIVKMKAPSDVGLLSDLYLQKTEVLLELFKFKRKNKFFEEALEFITEAERSTKNANRFITLIDIKRIQSELGIAVQNWEKAENELIEAIEISDQINVLAIKKEIEDRLFYIKAAKELGVEKSLDSNLNSAIGSIRFAQGLPNLEYEYTPKIDCEKIAIASYYLDSKIGTKIIGKTIPETFSRNIPNFEAVLSHQGTMTMMMLGQGDSYTEGIYILPCHKAFPNSDLIVYGTTIENPKDPDLRGQEAAYIIISIIFPKVVNAYISIRKKAIREIIKEKLTNVTNISNINDELIAEIKQEICNLK